MRKLFTRRSYSLKWTQAYNVQSTFQFQECTLPIIGGAASTSTVTSFATCFDNCKFNGYALFTPALLNTNFQCNCYDTEPLSLTLLACQKGVTSFYYGHPTQYSGLARRAMKERLEIGRNQERRALCPGKKTACTIPDAEDSFEVSRIIVVVIVITVIVTGC